MTEADVRARLRERIDKAGGLRAWCRSVGANPAHTSRFLNGHTPCRPALAKALGLVLDYEETVRLRRYRELRP